jgi:hypothetical protein
VGRKPDEVALVAVSKTVPLERLRAAALAGFDRLGENRVQEAADKAPALPEVEWHLVGHLQGNKSARAIELFDVIGSVDSVSLAERLDRLVSERGTRRGADRLAVYVQVNVDDDPGKEGFDRAELDAALGSILSLERLDVRGLMTVGRLSADPGVARRTFARLRDLSGLLRARHHALGGGLSMGMSDDFDMAIEEGSTLVRVGRALFGERPVT